jgi:hypothetical protein
MTSSHTRPTRRRSSRDRGPHPGRVELRAEVHHEQAPSPGGRLHEDFEKRLAARIEPVEILEKDHRGLSTACTTRFTVAKSCRRRASGSIRGAGCSGSATPRNSNTCGKTSRSVSASASIRPAIFSRAASASSRSLIPKNPPRTGDLLITNSLQGPNQEQPTPFPRACLRASAR